MDESTREEVQRIVEVTTLALELRTERVVNTLRDDATRSLNELRAEVAKIPIAVAHEIAACQREHKTGSRWGVQTMIALAALAISFSVALRSFL